MGKIKYIVLTIPVFLLILTAKYFTKTAESAKPVIITIKEKKIEKFNYKEIINSANIYGKHFAYWLKNNLNRSIVPSVVTGIVKNNRLIYNYGLHADIDTKFGIASLSKTFTAVLTLLLHQEGKISIYEPVTKYLPGVIIEREELESEPVKIWHLLSHTSGIPSYGKKYQRVEINGRKLSFLKQMFPAGSCYAYQNINFVLMKHVIEAATGISYAKNLREKIFKPLAMSASSGSNSNGTGGIVSTLRDLKKYASMLIHGGKINGKTFLKDETLQLMLGKSVELPEAKVNSFFSLSWVVTTVNGKVERYNKTGRWFKEASIIEVFPEKKIAYIYLCNPPQHRKKSFLKWRRKLTYRLRLLLKQIVHNKKILTPRTRLTSNILTNYRGSYSNVISGKTINIKQKGNNLYSDQMGLSKLRPFTTNRFSYGPRSRLYNFVWKNKKVVGLVLMNGYYKRIN